MNNKEEIEKISININLQSECSKIKLKMCWLEPKSQMKNNAEKHSHFFSLFLVKTFVIIFNQKNAKHGLRNKQYKIMFFCSDLQSE